MNTATIERTFPKFRKTKAGDWVVFGPADVVKPGFVTVSKKSGHLSTEKVTGTGKPFAVDGIQMVYGYLKPQEESALQKSETAPAPAKTATAQGIEFMPDDMDEPADAPADY